MSEHLNLCDDDNCCVEEVGDMEMCIRDRINPLLSASLFLLLSAGLLLLRHFNRSAKITYWILNLSVMLFALNLILDSQYNVYLTLGVVSIVAFILYFTYDHLVLDKPCLLYTSRCV